MFTDKDLVHVKNLQRFLGKAKAELEGEEILAAADTICWVANIKRRIEDALKPVPSPIAAPAVEPVKKKSAKVK